MLRSCIVAFVFSYLLASSSQAQQLFDFIEDGSGDVLATLEVFNFPANDASDFGALSLTPAGSSALSLSGEPISVDITTALGFGQTVFADQGGLSLDISGATVASGLGTGSTLIGTTEIALTFIVTEDPTSASLLALVDSNSIRTTNGRFAISVPEPATGSLLVTALLSGVRFVRPRR